VWAGNFEQSSGLPPPPNSWASDPSSDVAIMHIELKAGATVTIPPASGGRSTNRVAYFVEGKEVTINGSTFSSNCAITLKADEEVIFGNPSSNTASAPTEILILQGRPIGISALSFLIPPSHDFLGEPVVQHGPFVMNTQSEIQQAFFDYRKTQFGGWPWPDDAMVFPAGKGRFALINGEEITPPSV
jgi:redox-sensitive bicupin YhaK (pirin superfamily)